MLHGQWRRARSSFVRISRTAECASPVIPRIFFFSSFGLILFNLFVFINSDFYDFFFSFCKSKKKERSHRFFFFYIFGRDFVSVTKSRGRALPFLLVLHLCATSTWCIINHEARGHTLFTKIKRERKG